MLKKRLIACLLWRDGFIVQSIGFKHTNAIGNAITAVDFFNTWAIDEIVLLDVSRESSKEKRAKFYHIVQELSKRCFVPLTVGGLIESIKDIQILLHNGADKVIINTQAFKDQQFVTKAAKIFGSQCIVVSIDAKRKNNFHEVYIDRGRVSTGNSAVEWARTAEKKGAGEIFLTSIDNDGGRKGYDLELIKNVSETVDIPVIASGGVGKWHHLSDGILKGKADAVSAANIFHYTEQSTKMAKEHMNNTGIDVRTPKFYNISSPRNPKYVV